ncbi:DUF4184 family protein [Flavobacterium algicola]|uniref:DUF4184 family protein n=1 Tax=Flavobacterium algicola TaxID=556529 RepID=UPI001EFD57AE|nr:DUF4184 family protein [Flavobacterium algicola]MCG9791635.1 DUF4184 family protein [Flavobacterium algicola]
MPFTFSHAAAVLPFLKNQKLSASALIVGTLSPDLEYFFRMKMKSEISHTLLGIFIIDLPLGLLVLFLFHLCIKNALLENLPTFFQFRTQELQASKWLQYFKNNFWVIIVSFVFGALTHLVWDSMTHWDGYIVRRFTFLNSDFNGVALYSYLQYISSVIGLVFMAIYFIKLPVNNEITSKINGFYWLWVLAISSMVFLIRLSFGIKKEEWATVLVSVISAVFIGLVIAGIREKNKGIW